MAIETLRISLNSSQPFFCKCSYWRSLQIPLKIHCLCFVGKCNRCFYLPWFEFWSMWTFALIMFIEPLFEVFSEACVEMIRIIYWLKDIDIKEIHWRILFLKIKWRSPSSLTLRRGSLRSHLCNSFHNTVYTFFNWPGGNRICVSIFLQVF